MTSLIGVIPAVILAQLLPFVIFDTLGALLPITAIPTISIASIAQSLFLGFSILFVFSILTLSIASQLKPALLLKTAITTTIEGRADKKVIYAFIAILLLIITVIVLTSPRPYFTLAFTLGAIATFIVLRFTSWILIKSLAFLKNTKKITLRLAVLSLTRAGNQTLTILVALGLALTLFTTIALIENNIKTRIADDIPEKAPAFFFIDIQKSQMNSFEQMLATFPEVADLQKVPNLRGRIKYINGIDAEDTLIDKSKSWLLRGDRGFTYLSEKPDYSEMIEGEWWASDYKGPAIVSIVEDVALAFNIGVGDEITLNILGRDITAKVANVRTVDWSTMTINFAITFAPGILSSAPHSYLATITAPQEIENQIMTEVAKQFPNVTAIQVREALQVVTNILEQIAIAMRVIASLALITGLLVLFSSILSTFRQRRYETVLMKVIGVTPKMISQATKIEFIILGAAAGVLALLIGSLASYLVIVYIMKFPWIFSISIASSIILSSLFITFIFSFWALSKVLQAKPNQYLKNE
jgi:putative ABC transport system permease protein